MERILAPNCISKEIQTNLRGNDAPHLSDQTRCVYYIPMFLFIEYNDVFYLTP